MIFANLADFGITTFFSTIFVLFLVIPYTLLTNQPGITENPDMGILWLLGPTPTTTKVLSLSIVVLGIVWGSEVWAGWRHPAEKLVGNKETQDPGHAKSDPKFLDIQSLGKSLGMSMLPQDGSKKNAPVQKSRQRGYAAKMKDKTEDTDMAVFGTIEEAIEGRSSAWRWDWAVVQPTDFTAVPSHRNPWWETNCACSTSITPIREI
ncbi:MAG: hypothetical protein LQ352_007843 [Teloschistes flavicans]|nr:MAG: hypothetical protein LQ352_007843 [Teloschistes flavicans]